MITIIDYGMGNLGSIKNMLKKIGTPSEITADKSLIKNASKLILPGVGSFDKAITNLNELGMTELIKEKASEGIPVLGICLGMQLLADGSEEGVQAGLGIVPGKVIKFQVPSNLKVPHMGWNHVSFTSKCPLYAGFEALEETRFYFVHTYHYEVTDNSTISGTTEYAYPFISSVQKGKIHGVQFHPEKSHRYGMALLKNFVELI
jgi:glutamine amidotransferase